MKKLLVLAFVMSMTMAVSAQITWNVKVGPGLATLWGDSNAQTHVVAKVGVGIEKPLNSNWSLMPSFEVAWKGLSYNVKEDETIDILYIQVPIVAAYRLNFSDAWNTTIKFGPYIACNVYDHYKWIIERDGVVINSGSGNEKANLLDVGINVGIDFEYHRYVFGVEAELGLLRLKTNKDNKNLAFYATIGYKF